MPVNTASLGPALAQGDRVSLLLSPRSNSLDSSPELSGLIVDDVLVLAIERENNVASIVVAVRDGNPGTGERGLEALLPLLGTSEIFIVHPTP